MNVTGTDSRVFVRNLVNKDEQTDYVGALLPDAKRHTYEHWYMPIASSREAVDVFRILYDHIMTISEFIPSETITSPMKHFQPGFSKYYA